MSETTSNYNGTADAEPQDGQKYLDEALDDLDSLHKFAAEEDLPPPSDIAKKTARRILKALAPSFPRSYGISPWNSGTVVIQPAHSHVNVFCDADGSVSVCVDHLDKAMDKHRAKTLDDAVMDFIKKALSESK